MTTYWVELSLGIDWSDWSSDTQSTDEAETTQLNESQYTRAKNVQENDILLHYVLGGVHCWAGYSHVVAPPTPIPNPQTESDKAFPYSMGIHSGKWLTSPEECYLTRSIKGLSHDNWHRKGYVRVEPSDAALIMGAVDDAVGNGVPIDDLEFLEKWKVLRDGNSSDRCKHNAKYRCTLCGTTGTSWSGSLSLDMSDDDLGWFLHAHHIKRVADGGDADLDNLLCVCPNCHRVVQRLGEAGLRELLHKRAIRGLN